VGVTEVFGGGVLAVPKLKDKMKLVNILYFFFPTGIAIGKILR
jgi:hypothetical protein